MRLRNSGTQPSQSSSGCSPSKRRAQIVSSDDGLNVAAIPAASRDELLETCGRIGDSKAPSLVEVSNKALKLPTKSRPDLFAKLFEACMTERIFLCSMELVEVDTAA